MLPYRYINFFNDAQRQGTKNVGIQSKNEYQRINQAAKKQYMVWTLKIGQPVRRGLYPGKIFDILMIVNRLAMISKNFQFLAQRDTTVVVEDFEYSCPSDFNY